MKTRYRRKQRIYTVVVGKKRPKIFVFVILFIVIFSFLFRFVPINEGEIYEKFYKICVESALGKNSSATARAYSPKFEPHIIMQFVSPVFIKTEKKEETQEATPKKKAVGKAKKVNEKSIVSRGLEIKNETDYEIDSQRLVSQARTYSASGDEPKVLIVHTHACETYSNDKGIGLGSAGTYRTTNEEKNMISIGEKVNDILKENGINVIHDKTLCDYPSYNSSYVKSLGVIEWYLEKYPSIEFVFDLHRDAIASDDGTPTKLNCKINGENAAQAMIVCGTDAMGLSNPYWKDNLIFALKIQKNLEEMYPGFMRPLNLRKERFNMHKTKGSLLFEIGTHGNTHSEAMLAARYLAEGIAETLKNK